MKYCLLTLSLLFSGIILMAQDKQALNTPYYWLKQAGNKAAAKDMNGVFMAMKNAADAGLYDVDPLIKNKLIQDILSTQQKALLEKRILANRSKIEKPAGIKVITTDITRFWKLYPYLTDSAITDAAAETIFLLDYILKGSAGLQTFYQIRMNNNLHRFIKKIRSTQRFYSSIQQVSKNFDALRPKFIAAANKLEKLYPASVFPPIYFLVGHLNNVGTADGYAGLLIGTEHLCSHKNIDTSQLTAVDKMVLFDSSLSVPLIIHEYVHFQQKNKPERTLLEFAIMEGVADFITYLLTGAYTNQEVYKYGFAHEQEIWKHFVREMSGENTDNWLFNTYNPETGYPGNLGYFVGFRICEKYFATSQNKKQSIYELLNIRDFDQFLLKSHYSGQ